MFDAKVRTEATTVSMIRAVLTRVYKQAVLKKHLLLPIRLCRSDYNLCFGRQQSQTSQAHL
jgi:hypothetical protein